MNLSTVLKFSRYVQFSSANSLLKTSINVLISLTQQSRQISTHKFPDNERAMTSRLTGKKTKLWEQYNEVVYPPRESLRTGKLDEDFTETRPAEVTYTKENILYSRKKLWLLAFMASLHICVKLVF